MVYDLYLGDNPQAADVRPNIDVILNMASDVGDVFVSQSSVYFGSRFSSSIIPTTTLELYPEILIVLTTSMRAYFCVCRTVRMIVLLTMLVGRSANKFFLSLWSCALPLT